MIIKSIAETSYSGMYKVAPTEGPAFFIRKEYLPGIDFDAIDVGSEYNEEQTEIFLDAGLTCAVELKAVSYLARAEQSHFGLSRKLREKGYDKTMVEAALTYLEARNYLSDERFARAWLHGRRLNHYEGRTKLIAELASRGIDKETSAAAVEEFFSENDEYEICCKAYERFIKRGKEGEKLIAAMMTAGFSYKLIKEIQDVISPEEIPCP